MTTACRRPWGAGSVERRGARWMARYRDSEGRQHGRTFDTPEQAGAYLDEVYPARGYRPVPVAQLRALAQHWRQAAEIATPQLRGPEPPDEDVSARVSILIRMAAASALKACATDLENLARGTGAGDAQDS